MNDRRDLSAQRHGIGDGWAVDTTIHIGHINVIESLDTGFAGRTGTRLVERLEDVVRGQGVRVSLHTPRDRTAVFELLGRIAQDARSGERPLLHFETHGIRALNSKVASPGIVLASGDEVTWRELAPSLAAINDATRLNLLVFMAACHGVDLARVIQPLEPAPVRFIIGPMAELSAGAVETSTVAFYSKLLQSSNGDAAFAAIGDALGPNGPGFWKMSAVDLFLQILVGYFNEMTTDEQIASRVEGSLAPLIREGLPPVVISQQRAILKARLEDRSRLFEDCYRKFFLVEKYPENAERFILSFHRCFQEASQDS